MKDFNINLKTKIVDLVNLYNQKEFFKVVDQTKKLIKQHPDAFILWNLLGAAFKSLGKIDESINSFKKVTKINPQYADGHNNLGVILQEQGRLDESIESFNKALFFNPNYAQAYNNIGIVYREKGKLDKAAECINKALSLNPNYAEAYNNLATTVKEQGKVDQALKYFNKALSLRPDYAEAYYNLGLAFSEQDEISNAVRSYKKALFLNPNYAQAYNNLATIFKEQGQLDEAIKLLNKAITLKPNFAEAYYNMGIILKGQNKFNSSLEFYHRALQFKSNYAEALYNIAIIFQEQGRLNEAINYYDKALLIRPSYDKAQAQRLYQKAKICDWKKFDQDKELISNLGISKNYIQPFTMLSFEDMPSNHLLRSMLFSKKKYLQTQIPFKEKSKTLRNKRLRIGYFSADFQNHATMYLISKIFEKYNREKFEVYVYSFGESSEFDSVREKLKNSVDVFRDVINLSEKDIAMLAREDQINIAIDLKGYTRGSRTGIFVYRAAPIQINFLGYPGTMGASFIDYIVADTVVIPDNQRKNYSEEIIYLPDTYWPTSYSKSIITKSFTKSEMGLPDEGFVFCCFNNTYKITPKEFNIWMRLLKKVEGSVLWLMASNKWVETNLLKEAKKRGVGSMRLIFAKKLPYAEHLARNKLGDLFLDTFYYNAHTTASDALWAGMPVVTKIGEGFTARVASSILKALDLPELITTNDEDYEALIFEIATSPKKLFEIKAKLNTNSLSKPLFNSEMFIKNLENGYEQVYENYLNDNKCKTIHIKK